MVWHGTFRINVMKPVAELRGYDPGRYYFSGPPFDGAGRWRLRA